MSRKLDSVGQTKQEGAHIKNMFIEAGSDRVSESERD